jgi:hypothetical protein
VEIPEPFKRAKLKFEAKEPVATEPRA